MAFTRPVVGTDILAADFGQPVYDWITAHDEGAWTNLTYASGFATFPSYGGFQMRLVGKMVQVRGVAINAAGFAAGTTMTVVNGFPVSCRPLIAQLLIGLGGLYSVGSVRFDFSTTGSITCNSSVAIPAGGFISVSVVYWVD